MMASPETKVSFGGFLSHPTASSEDGVDLENWVDCKQFRASAQAVSSATVWLWSLLMNRWLIPTLAGGCLCLAPLAVSHAEREEEILTRVRQVLAQLEGELAVPGLRESVLVRRDRWGVPHIQAKSQDDLFFAQGFVAAQDRLFQMDMWRRVNLGETAEVLGRRGLEGDLFARLLRYRGDMQSEWASYAPDAQRIATAFTNGINAYIDHLGDRLPIEFQILHSRPARWKPEDCLGRMSGIIMTKNFQSEISRAELIQAVGLEAARRLAPTDPARAFKPLVDLAGIDSAVLRGYQAATRPQTFASASGGSNNWAVSGNLSASGKPLLASDPHRAITLPSLRYLIHLKAPGWNVIGAGEPGLPGVSLGHNEHIAWGFTIVGTDQADLYVEETHPQDELQYRVGDRWQRMTVVREQAKVQGEAAPIQLELRFTRHGPVIHQDLERRRAFALKWAGAEPGGAAYLGSLAIDRARDWNEFLAAMNSWKTPGENMAYADIDGNIGWIAAGLAPVRKGSDGLLPVPGATGEFDWQGFRPVSELPQAFNPARQYVATANHNILPSGAKQPLSFEWALPYRFARIKSQLDAMRRFDLGDFQRMQHDNVSLPGQRLVRLARFINSRDPQVQRHAETLKNWDGNLTSESPAGALYAIWLQELSTAFYKPHVPEKLLTFVRSGRGTQVLLAALEDADPAWFGEQAVQARDQLLRKSFTDAIHRLQTLMPGDPAQWTWGRLHGTHFRHPLEALGAEYAKAFNLGPVPRAGDAHTPNAAAFNEKFQQISGASYRQLFDLADWDRGLATSAPGQSGQPGSPHYADLLPLWAEGKYFPFVFSDTRVEEVTLHRLTLKPR
jgi:penicillin amidase